MSNPFDAYLSAALKTKFDQAIQALINFGERPCRMYMDTTKTEDCPSCFQGGNVTGPNPYINSQGNTGCAICGGDGKIESEVTSTTDLVVIFDTSKFIDAGGNVKYTNDMAQTVSRVSETHTDLLRCKYIIFDTEIEHFKNDRYERDGRPQTLGLGDNQYLITNWKKIK